MNRFCYWPVRGRLCRNRPTWRLRFGTVRHHYCSRHRIEMQLLHPTFVFDRVPE